MGGEQLEIPAEPGVKDPCGEGNAKWVVPDDSDTLDWTLTDGVLTVEILAPDTVFEGTDDTTYSFGEAEESNTDECDVKGEQEHPQPAARDVEVTGSRPSRAWRRQRRPRLDVHPAGVRAQPAVVARARRRAGPDRGGRPAPAPRGVPVTHSRTPW